jgi:hypothetical protein
MNLTVMTAGLVVIGVIVILTTAVLYEKNLYRAGPKDKDQLTAIDGYDWFVSELDRVMSVHKFDPHEACSYIIQFVPKKSDLPFDHGVWKAYGDTMENYFESMKIDHRTRQLLRQTVVQPRAQPGKMRRVIR